MARRLRTPLLLVLALTLAAMAAACGSGDSDKEEAKASPSVTQPAQAAATQAPKKGDDPSELTMAFVPSRDVSAIQLQADKIAAYLSKELNKPVKSVTLTSYAAVSTALQNKRADIAWVGPLDYLIGYEQHGAYPVTCSVRNGQRGYYAQIIVRSDSGINGVADLKNKTFAFGDVVSASSNLMPRGALKAAGLDPAKDVKGVNIPNQSAIAIAVYEGKADGGATYEDARTNKEVIEKYPDILQKTKVINKTELIPCDPQIVRKDLDESLVARIQTALLKLSDDAEGKVWLKDLFTIDSLSKAADKDYDPLRQIVRQIQPDLLKGYPEPTPKP